MKKIPYGTVLDFLKVIKALKMSHRNFNELYLDLAVKAANIVRFKYENEISNRTKRP
jgi:hypothetical protein